MRHGFHVALAIEESAVSGIDDPVEQGLANTASRLLPELDEHLSRTAERVVGRRDVEVRSGDSVAEALDDCALLSDR